MITPINQLYQQVHENILKNKGEFSWLNLGYWKNADTVAKACQDLVALVANFGELADNQRILDVGFGYGVQDIFLAKKYNNLEIRAINSIKKQVEIANLFLQKEKVSSKIEFIEGDAVEYSFIENSFDRIICIEAAFHFNTRENFFDKAYKALKNNGVICLAEGLPNEAYINDEMFIQRSKFLGIPIENQYGIEKYREKLEQIGFSSIEFLDISEAVIPFSAVAVKHQSGWRTEEKIELPKDKATLNDLIASFKKSTTIDKYYIIKARKAS